MTSNIISMAEAHTEVLFTFLLHVRCIFSFLKQITSILYQGNLMGMTFGCPGRKIQRTILASLSFQRVPSCYSHLMTTRGRFHRHQRGMKSLSFPIYPPKLFGSIRTMPTRTAPLTAFYMETTSPSSHGSQAIMDTSFMIIYLLLPGFVSI